MARKICPVCKGTGKEPCAVHGSHACSRCHGKGCIEDGCSRTTWVEWEYPFPRKHTYLKATNVGFLLCNEDDL